MLLNARGINKSYGSLQVLKSVDLQIEQGEFVCLMGPSGSGKSTLLHILGTLDKPDVSASASQIMIDGQDLLKMSEQDLALFRRRRMGFVFQFFNLLPNLSALENAALPALLDGVPMREASTRSLELLSAMGLSDRKDHRPATLSGGQMQRVAIARALFSKPALLLADEPTGNLDSKTGLEIMNLLKKLNQEQNLTILMVSHDPRSADFCSRLVQMKDGEIADQKMMRSH